MWNPEIEYQRLRTDEWMDIRDEVVLVLTRSKILGYPTYPGVSKWFIKNGLMPRVKKITHYIYTRDLCLTSFFSTITEKELWSIID